MVIFAHGRDERAAHALALQTQHHHDVAALQPLFHRMKNLRAEPFRIGGNECARPYEMHLRPHHIEQQQIGARHARMGDVAANRHAQPVEATEAAAYGERVEECLRRVFVRPVACIEDGAGGLLGEERDRAAFIVAHDQQIGMHGVQGHRSVEQRLAFREGGGGHVHVHHIRAQPLARQLERALRAGGAFEKQIDLRAPAQGLDLLRTAAIEGDVILGQVEKRGDVGGRKAFDTEQISVGKAWGI